MASQAIVGFSKPTRREAADLARTVREAVSLTGLDIVAALDGSSRDAHYGTEYGAWYAVALGPDPDAPHRLARQLTFAAQAHNTIHGGETDIALTVGDHYRVDVDGAVESYSDPVDPDGPAPFPRDTGPRPSDAARVSQ